VTLEPQRLVELAQEATSRVTTEIALIGAGACLVALILSLALRPGVGERIGA